MLSHKLSNWSNFFTQEFPLPPPPLVIYFTAFNSATNPMIRVLTFQCQLTQLKVSKLNFKLISHPARDHNWNVTSCIQIYLLALSQAAQWHWRFSSSSPSIWICNQKLAPKFLLVFRRWRWWLINNKLKGLS